MNININFECPACKNKYLNTSELNKHLHFCKLYEEWIKTYTPPVQIKCENCNLSFVKKKYLYEHKKKCFS